MRRSFALAILVVLFAADSKAQTKAPSTPPPLKRAQVPAARPPISYSDAPFDPEATELPPKYFGTSIQRLISTNAQAPRGEFETTAQYEARTSKASGAGVYAFLLGEGSKCFFAYNADSQAFNVTVYAEFGVYISYKPDYRTQALVVSAVETSSRKYEASNAFGAKATVSSSHNSIRALIPSNWNGGSPRKISISVPVPIEEAPRVKGALRALAVFRFSGSADAIASGTHMIPATIDGPQEIFQEFKYIRGELLSIWVYSVETGRVYAKTPQ